MPQSRREIAIVGTGYVADLYMKSLKMHPETVCIGAFDIRGDRLAKFCEHWSVRPFGTLQDLLSALPEQGLVLNLTNPSAHFDVSRSCLEAGRNVFSEKPLALDLNEARQLIAIAEAHGLSIASAPSSYLSETAQTLAAAVNAGLCGTIRLVYAELDDGFIPQAPYRKWFSESGAPWPFVDEFRSGCTVEHAGYYLTWLISMFGTIRSITAASARTVDKGLVPQCETPDFSVGVLFFESGPVVRLTCSIVAPHDHRIRCVGDNGVLEVDEAWNNTAPVRFRRRMTIRRRLLESPYARRVSAVGAVRKPSVRRFGSAKMDFALGPVQMLEEILGSTPRRCTPALALHVTEATLALQNSGESSSAYEMQTRCDAQPPMPWAHQIR